MVRVRSFRCVTRVHTARARHRRVRAAMPGRDAPSGFFSRVHKPQARNGAETRRNAAAGR